MKTCHFSEHYPIVVRMAYCIYLSFEMKMLATCTRNRTTRLLQVSLMSKMQERVIESGDGEILVRFKMNNRRVF
jgi:hypothetical protein